MKYINRNTSIITGKKNLEPLYTLKNFPVFIGCTDQLPVKDLVADMSLAICKDTGVIQLDKVLPLNIVYPAYHSEAIGDIWKKHHQSFAAFISRYPVKKVLEIGGSNGRLAITYLDGHRLTQWTMVEPNPLPGLDSRIRVITRAFNSEFASTTAYDAIIHSHVLEHMYEPRNFLEKTASLLKPGQYQLFSVPNLYLYLKNYFTNVINFEHTVFLTEYFTDYLLSLTGFEIIEKTYFRQHSIFYAVRKTSEFKKFPFRSHYRIYKKKFHDYFLFNQRIINRYNKKIGNHKGKVYLFGAHIFSQYLLNQGLKIPPNLISILDNSRLKQGKRLYGTAMMVNSPQIIKNENKPAVILNVGAYEQEIEAQLTKINPQVIIWK